MAPLKVLISGAGIGGLALAFWLSKLGHQVTVVERFPGIRTNGLQIDLRGQGIEVLKLMGLEQAFRANAAPEQGMQLVDRNGKGWAYFPANKKGEKIQSITSEFEIMRGDLCRIMHEATDHERVEYKFGTSIDGYDEIGGKVDVRFVDGTTGRYDLVVGADGQWSRTRKLMLGGGQAAADCLKPLEECVAYFTAKKPMKPGEKFDAQGLIATQGRFVMMRRHSPHTVQIYLMGNPVTERLHKVERGDIQAEKQAFADTFRGAGWKTEELLQDMMDCDDFYCERKAVVKLDSWSQGRVVLLGDAAHAPSGDTGMGTTCAIIGAYLLAGEITRHCGNRDKEATTDNTADLMAAIKAYEDKFRPFINGLQKGVGEPSVFDKISIPWTPLTIYLVQWAFWVASWLRLDLFAGWLIANKVKGWDLPEYKELPVIST